MGPEHRLVRWGVFPTPKQIVELGKRLGNERALRKERLYLNILLRKMAETEGFEPSIPDNGYGSLAGNWFQPLTHVSEPSFARLRR